VVLCHAKDDGVGTQSPTWTMDSSLIFASPFITRYPLMLQLGELFPQFTRTHADILTVNKA